MADLHAATSTYETGTNDTYTAVADNTDDVLAIHQNGPASAIIAIQTILGTGTDLKGSVADMNTRLAVNLEANGKLKDFSATTKTTFPPTTAEGCLGDVTANFAASQLVRKHATLEKMETTGYTVPGSSGVMVSEDDTQTLTGKTLTTPTIGSFTNAPHDHTDAAGGGGLGSAVVARSQLVTTTVSLAGSVSSYESIDITLNAYAFVEHFHTTERINGGDGLVDAAIVVTGHSTDAASADSPRYALLGWKRESLASTSLDYDIDYRYVTA